MALAVILPALEAEGIRSFEMDDEDEFGRRPDPAASWSSLAEVGVRRGRALPGDATEPPVVLIGSSGGFATAPDVINDLVVVEARSNRAKLGVDGHLFVWVDSLDHRSWVGMDLECPPRQRPGAEFPVGVTAWVARRPSSGGWVPDRLWILRPSADWASLSGSSDVSGV